MKIFICLAIAAVAVNPLLADERDRAAAALAIAQAVEATKPATSNAHYFTSYKEAAAESRKTGKPMFISVNTDCSRLCKDLVSDYVILHASQFYADGVSPPDRPRLLLTIPHATLDRQWRLGQWDTLPTAKQVREAERLLKPTIPAVEAIPLRRGEMRVYEGTPALIPEQPIIYAPMPAPAFVPSGRRVVGEMVAHGPPVVVDPRTYHGYVSGIGGDATVRRAIVSAPAGSGDFCPH